MSLPIDGCLDLVDPLILARKIEPDRLEPVFANALADARSGILGDTSLAKQCVDLIDEGFRPGVCVGVGRGSDNELR